MCKTATALLLEQQFHTDLQDFFGKKKKKGRKPQSKTEERFAFGLVFLILLPSLTSLESNKSSEGKKYLLVSLRDLNTAR